MRVPFSQPWIGEEEIAEVAATLRSGWLAMGPRTRQFERAFADYTGARHAIATSSCTGALHIALAALGIGPGDEVITSAMTFAATALAIVHVGARPVFCDVDADTLNLSLSDLERRMTARTRAVVAVHYAGRPCDLDALRALCEERQIALIEDCAHAVGARYGDRHVGTASAAGAFSFYANKNLTTGEGGMLVVGSAELAEKARPLRLQGMSRDAYARGGQDAPAWQYDVVDAGFKYPFSDIAAAIGIHQLARFDAMQATRRKRVARYQRELADVSWIETPPDDDAYRRSAWHLYVVRVRAGHGSRDRLFRFLEQREVQASVHFTPLPMHTYFREKWGARIEEFPVAANAYHEILSLPLFPAMTDEQQDHVIASIREFPG